ncbi:MAG: hypothetical protein Q8926_14795 [Bacteroidota bacterium]|nr:hypothetical protein [Bacteroidota bacterium]
MRKISPFYKLISCIIAGLSASFCFIRIGHRFLAEWLPRPLMLGISGFFFLTALGYGICWAFIKKDERSDSPAILDFWQALISYTIAIDLIMIGIQGFYQLLFFVPLGVLDLPFSSLSGEQLTWAYFGHYSHGFVYFIGSIQIFGSLLLLFGRTRLAGVFILVPVMLAIVSLNYFFDMEFAETIHAIEILIALSYLLFSDGQRIWRFFFTNTPTVSAFPLKSVLLKNLLRASSVLIPLLLIWRFGSPDLNPWLTGKYKVSHLVIDHQAREVRDCTDSLLSSVYLDLGNECVFEFNSTNRRWYGSYHLSDDSKKIAIAWRYPLNIRDTLTGKISKNGTDSLLFIEGKMGKDSIQVSLIRQGRHKQ